MHVGAIEHDIVVQLAEAVIDMMKMGCCMHARQPVRRSGHERAIRSATRYIPRRIPSSFDIFPPVIVSRTGAAVSGRALPRG